MKLFVITACIASFVLASCKKENNATITTPPVDPPAKSNVIKINDPNAITASLKIWHSETKKGAIPVNHTATSPVLAVDSNQHQLYGIPGGMVTFKPNLSSGTVAGYYFKIKGASSYFDIDFSRARGAKISAGNLNQREGDEDSLIVLQVPDSLETGTFCGVYYVWNDNREVSDSMEICITILHKGPNMGGSGFTGTWRFNAYQLDNSGTWIYSDGTNRFRKEGYYCKNDVLTIADCVGQPGCLATDSMAFYQQFEPVYNYIFYPNGDYELRDSTVSRPFNFSKSTCSQLVFDQTTSSQVLYGVWSWDDNIQKLIVITEGTSHGSPNFHFKDFEILEKTDTSMLVSYTDAWKFFYKIDFRKQ